MLLSAIRIETFWREIYIVNKNLFSSAFYSKFVNSDKQTLQKSQQLGNFGRFLIAKRLGNPALNRAESCVSFVTKLVTSKTVGGIVSCQTQKPQNQASLSLICTKRSPFFCSTFCVPKVRTNPFLVKIRHLFYSLTFISVRQQDFEIIGSSSTSNWDGFWNLVGIFVSCRFLGVKLL